MVKAEAGPGAVEGSPARGISGQGAMVKPSLLVVELWGMGDLVIATPFLQAATRHFRVTLLAKPFAFDLQRRFWPEVRVVPFVAPWTAFRRKYWLHEWPWREIFRLRKLAAERFQIALSARWDPRDHLLLLLLGARRRLGFPRLRSEWFLNSPIERPGPAAHRYDNWRELASALGMQLPAREQLPVRPSGPGSPVLLHTGAGQPIRVWPLPRYAALLRAVREAGYKVQVACDPDQRAFWLGNGEEEVRTPKTVSELLSLIDQAGAFIGNDSGPSHLAAFCGVPTFTIFGPQLPEWFSPLHPASESLEGKPCPYKPCSDYCRFPAPYCLMNTKEEEVRARVRSFLQRLGAGSRG
jgi:ADP-heptose:LPS heptosyltransferase